MRKASSNKDHFSLIKGQLREIGHKVVGLEREIKILETDLILHEGN
jgi:hypothetical protein